MGVISFSGAGRLQYGIHFIYLVGISVKGTICAGKLHNLAKIIAIFAEGV